MYVARSPLWKENIYFTCQLGMWKILRKWAFNVKGVGFRFLRLGNRMCYIPTCLAMLFTPISFCVSKFS